MDAIRPSLEEFERLAADYPQVAGRLKYVGTYKGAKAPYGTFGNAIAHASVDGARLGLNPDYYGDPEKLKRSVQASKQSKFLDADGTIESIMAHEYGHHVENWLLDATDAFMPSFAADGLGVVNETVRLFNKKLSPTKALSRYATTTNTLAGAGHWVHHENKAEGWAEAFAAIRRTPRNAWPAYVKKIDKLLGNIANPATWQPLHTATPVTMLRGPDRDAANDAIAKLRKDLGL